MHGLNNKTRRIAAAIDLDGGDMFAGRPGRMARMHPRRDENGHDNGGKTDGDDKGGNDSKKTDDKGGDDDDPKPVDVKKSAEYRAESKRANDEKKRADDLQTALDEANRGKMSDDEKARDDEKKTAVSTAVAAKETELTDHYEGRIATLQGQIIESTIDAVFAGGSLERKDFEDVIATLDTSHFINDDGSVDREKVKKTLAPITKAAVQKPPRTGGRIGAKDNGFGRYLQQQDN